MEDDQQDTTQTETAPLTESKVQDLINKAFGPRFVRLKEQVAKLHEEATAALLAPILEQQAGISKTLEGLAERPNAPAEGQPTAREQEQEKQIAAQGKKIEALMLHNQEREQALVDERAKASKKDEEVVLRKHLLDAGARPEFVEFAIKEAHPSVVRGEAGEVLWRGATEYDDPLQPAEGVKLFLDTKLGKKYLPATPADRGAASHNRAGNERKNGRMGDAELTDHITSRGRNARNA